MKKTRKRQLTELGWCAAVWLVFFVSHNAFAQTSTPEGDSAISGPFSEYGEFDTDDEEAEDEKFFQQGRFFGLGFGAGLTSPSGNKASLYQGGIPTVNFRLSFWFDFSFAFQLSLENSRHNYDAPPDGLTDVNFFRTMFQIKYYINTRDLSAPVTFVGPHIIAGGGFYQRTDNIGSGESDSSVGNSVDKQQAFGVNGGLGFELTLKPKRTFVQIEFLVHSVQYADDLNDKFSAVGIPDRTGLWIVSNISVMWTW